MKRSIAFFVALLLAAPAVAEVRVPAAGTVKIISLLPRNESFTLFPDQQGFYFQIDTMIQFDLMVFPCLEPSNNPTNTFGIPKANPTGESQPADNPAYRDYVNALMLAFSLNKPIIFYVDGCLNSLPRVVGLDVLQ